MAWIGAFGPNLTSVTLTAGVASSNVALPNTALAELIAAGGNEVPVGFDQVEVINTGTVTAFINFGGSGVTATTSNYPLPPGTDKIITISPDLDYVAAITASSTAVLYFINGQGI